MKLFIWSNPYSVNYGSSAYFAVADSVEQARELANAAPGYAFVEYKDGHPGNAEDVKGEPTRVVELPCGEWHKWEE